MDMEKIVKVSMDIATILAVIGIPEDLVVEILRNDAISNEAIAIMVEKRLKIPEIFRSEVG
jgi:hypothetical protein